MSDRALLARLCAGPASGAALARDLGITRAAVWKRIEALRAAGVDVLAAPGSGYRLVRPLQLLAAEPLTAALSAPARAELAGLEVLFETDSTNAVALREPAPAHGTRVWLAERQTAGRGRRGREWRSPLAANLYLSLSRRFEGGIAALQGLSLAVGVATCDVLHALGHREVGLKWPNDLLARGRKLGGVLVEVGGDAGGPLRVVIGIGLNVAMPAATVIDQPWIDLATLARPLPTARPSAATPGASTARPQIAVALLDALLPMLARFEVDGLAPFLPGWQRHDLLAQQPVRLLEGGRVHEGIAEGIAGDGALRLRLADGVVRHCHAGEASLRTA